jgi:hypothetical protein
VRSSRKWHPLLLSRTATYYICTRQYGSTSPYWFSLVKNWAWNHVFTDFQLTGILGLILQQMMKWSWISCQLNFFCFQGYFYFSMGQLTWGSVSSLKRWACLQLPGGQNHKSGCLRVPHCKKNKHHNCMCNTCGGWSTLGRTEPAHTLVFWCTRVTPKEERERE